MIHRPSSRHSAPGGGGGCRVSGSTVGPAVAGIAIPTSPARARMVAPTSVRSRALGPTTPSGEAVLADVTSLCMAPPWAWYWWSPEARRQEGPPEPGQP
jgi:hypothetical protein